MNFKLLGILSALAIIKSTMAYGDVRSSSESTAGMELFQRGAWTVGQSSSWSSQQGYLDRILSWVGLDASRIARWLTGMGEPAYRLANIRDQSCRVRLACDLGSAIYGRVNYMQNIMIRGTVRLLLSSDSAYSKPWTSGMTGQNCSLRYPECSSWQLEAMGDMLFPPSSLTTTTTTATYRPTSMRKGTRTQDSDDKIISVDYD